MLGVYREYIDLLKKMVKIYKETKVNLTLTAYSRTDDDGELTSFGCFLAENIMSEKRTTYKLDWISGYLQDTINLFNSYGLYCKLEEEKHKIRIQRMKDIHGEIKMSLRNYQNKHGEKISCDWTDDVLEEKAINLLAEKTGKDIEAILTDKLKDYNVNEVKHIYLQHDEEKLLTF